MPSAVKNVRPTPAAALSALVLALSAIPSAGAAGHDGTAILRMCQGADKVKSLSVMCHSYLNGYLDTTAWHEGEAKGKRASFCLGAGDKEKLPGKLVLWLRAHPAEHAKPAPEILGKALRDLFPCR